MKNTKFYICNHCRNIVEMIYDTDIPLYCCGDKMENLIPGFSVSCILGRVCYTS